MPALRLFILTILLPLITVAMLWRRPRRPVGGWIATLLLAGGMTGFSVLAAPWGWFGLPARYALVLLFAAAIVFSLRRPAPAEQKEESPLRAIVKVLLAVFFGGVALGALRAHEVPARAVELAFPLRGGAFLIAHGGSTSAANMHHAHPRQRFALDVMKLNSFGTRARGLYPRDLHRYAIFDAEVLSPCNGAVVTAVDALPDNAPGVLDAKNPPGNHVIVRCADADVMLAHLRRGSVAVRAGANVAVGQRVGQVGNSGNTTEPHLHVHAERNGAAVPATFDGEWWVRNEIARR